MFEKYIKTISEYYLRGLIPQLTSSAKEIVNKELRRRNQIVTVWFEIQNDHWEQFPMTYPNAEEFAQTGDLECRNCWAIIFNLDDYLQQKGYCVNCVY